MTLATVQEYLKRCGYTLVQEECYSDIAGWLAWYQNEVKDFHTYHVYNGSRMVDVKRYRLGMAKTCCEDHANLLLNERVQISAQAFKPLDDILAANQFRTRANRLVELAYALGTGAFVEYLGADKAPVIDYIRADMIYPLSWEGQTVRECAFASYRVMDKVEGYYIQIHKRDEQGLYVIENKYITKDGADLEPPDGVEPIVHTGSDLPFFQIITPNVVNNLRLDSPLGISVYGNAIRQLMALDVVYDSYVNEFVLGRKRIMVPMDMAQVQIEDSGLMTPLFDPDDTTFYAFKTTDDAGNGGIKEIDMNLRSEDHDTALQKQLDVFSKKVGLGNGYYRFENGQVKTATEVVSAQSDLYKNRQKNQIPLEAAIIGMVRALSFLTGGAPDIDVSVDFDDSIIEDTQAIVQTNVLLVTNGLRSKVEAIMEIEKCSEEEARAKLEAINSESSVSAGAVDAFALAPEGGGTDGSAAPAAESAVVDKAEDVAGKTLNGAQTQSLIGVIQQFQAKQLTEGQAINVISIAIGVTKEEARALLNGVV